MRRHVEAVLLLLVGGTLIKLVATGGYLRYVRPAMAPLLVCSGVVLIAVGAGSFARIRRDHAHGGPVGWLLLVPILLILVAPPPTVDTFGAARSGTAVSRPTGRFAPLPSTDPAPLTLTDYAARALYGHGSTLRTRRVLLTGFVTRGAPGQEYLTRMVITCCAADARPVKVRMAGRIPADLAADAWLSVIGRYDSHTDADPLNTNRIPYLDVLSYRRVAAPSQPYE
ncbi:TIGR03943 family putative permease subunit [Actinocatenispora comari]|uniref:Membrane protein n=1 Tax=Actinocatenispora comari TaxID=2807577 RepID=A0A8J4EIY2_9ACTN|nr:TIGR03943 family protein [Actinocatenispora comari]GIL25358.1 membrane protein [Actinocatenispora comari]